MQGANATTGGRRASSGMRGALVVLPMIATASFSVVARDDAQWQYTAGDAGSRKYSPLSQIDSGNVQSLQVAWSWDSPDDALVGSATRERPGWFKSTPLYANGVLYTSTSFSEVAAVDPATGKTLWVYDPKAYDSGRRPANTGWQNRGVAYWTGRVGGRKEERILVATGTGDLISVDAHTGKVNGGFGRDGRVDLQAAIIRNEEDRKVVGFNSPPLVVGDVVVLGGVIADRHRPEGVPAGSIQAFDIRTGAVRWIFHTVPKSGDPGSETWLNDSARTAGAANAWAPLSADLKRGIIYAATGTPSNDFYGGARPGNNLYAENLLALDARSGKLLWHFQSVHHGLWDYDFPAAPTLVDIKVDGKRIAAVAQITKHGFTFVFDRVTGKPVWPIEERPVPQSMVPGERSSATQPFPTKPPPFARQGVSESDLVDFTPELHAEALKIASEYQLGPLFTPPIVPADGKKGIMFAPSTGGGGNWGGAGFDPELGYLFLDVADTYAVMGVGKLPPPAAGANAPLNANDTYEVVAWSPIGPQVANGVPLLKPPYGSVVAIDLNNGSIAWKVPHGDGPRNHPALRGLNLPPLGATRMLLSGAGPLVTSTLLFMNQVQNPGMAIGSTGYYLRAFDKRTGRVVWEHEMDTPPNGIPMTYEHKGKQYIAVATGGAGVPARLQAFALPEQRR